MSNSKINLSNAAAAGAQPFFRIHHRRHLVYWPAEWSAWCQARSVSSAGMLLYLGSSISQVVPVSAAGIPAETPAWWWQRCELEVVSIHEVQKTVQPAKRAWLLVYDCWWLMTNWRCVSEVLTCIDCCERRQCRTFWLLVGGIAKKALSGEAKISLHLQGNFQFVNVLLKIQSWDNGTPVATTPEPPVSDSDVW